MKFLEIGRILHNSSDDEVRQNPGNIEGEIEIFADFSDGLLGLDRYEHIFVLSIMHKHLNEKYPLRVKPRLLLKKGYSLDELPEFGVFASDSPSRPNPIGLTLVKVRGIKDNVLEVSGLDLFNGTPVIDIKPYNKRYLANSAETQLECDAKPDSKK